MPLKSLKPFEDEEGQMGGRYPRKGAAKSRTPVLDNFGRDITKAAEEGRLDPIVGREKELERIMSKFLETIASAQTQYVVYAGLALSAIACAGVLTARGSTLYQMIPTLVRASVFAMSSCH